MLVLGVWGVDIIYVCVVDHYDGKHEVCMYGCACPVLDL